MTATFECRGLSKRFGATQALEDVNISIAPGRVVGLLGPNGSGKTTLIKLANGLLSPSQGELLICGSRPGPETKAVVSYLPDKPCMPQWMNAVQLMDFFQDFYADFDRQRAEEMLARLGLDQKQKLSQMSKGTKEKVQLILVMSRKAQLYLLDEVVFLKNGKVVRHEAVDDIKEKEGKSIDDVFKDTFRMGVAGYDR